MKIRNIEVPEDRIAAFCQKWKVKELSLFGSVLRDDFHPESDVDVLFTLEPGDTMTLQRFLDMRNELSAMFGGRNVDLVQKRLLKNPFRRYEILTTREVVYAG